MKNTELSVAEKLIPGFSLLTETERREFFTTEVGQRFKELVQIASIQSWTQWLFNNPALTPELINQFNDEICNTPEWEKLVNLIIQTLLLDIKPDLQHVGDINLSTIANEGYSRDLYPDLVMINAQIEMNTPSPDPLANLGAYALAKQTLWSEAMQKKQAMITRWESIYNVDPETYVYNTFITFNKTNARLLEFENFLPGLKLTLDGSSSLDRLKRVYETSDDELDDELENELFDELFELYLQSAFGVILKQFNLQEFNRLQAHNIAQAVLEKFRNKETCNLKQVINEYVQNLERQIKDNLLFINGKPWQSQSPTEAIDIFSLSKLLPVKEITAYLDQVGAAHAFFQYMGMASQNDSHLALLDVYNYLRHGKTVTENFQILRSLFFPFVPLYEEYKNIAFNEKSVPIKLIRTLIPLLIIAITCIAILLLLAGLGAMIGIGIPDIAFLIAAIPAVFIGLAVATGYALLKNKAYAYLKSSLHFGHYNTPEFKVNERMILAFADIDPDKAYVIAKQVRDYYINELKIYEAKEKEFKKGEKLGILSIDDLNARKANLEYGQILFLEWYHIHNNASLGVDKVRAIVFKRLQATCAGINNDLQACVAYVLKGLFPALESQGNKLAQVLGEKEPADAEGELSTPKEFKRQLGVSPAFFSPKRSIELSNALKASDQFSSQFQA